MPWKHNTKVSARALMRSHILSFPRPGKEGRLNLETVLSGVKGNLNLRKKKKKKTQLAEVKATSALMVMT